MLNLRTFISRTYRYRQQGNHIYLVTVLLSLLLSWLAFSFGELPNRDTYAYLRTAELAISNGVNSAYEHYAWAHFSLLIAGLSQVTGLSLMLSAQVIMSVLFALLSVAFVNLVAMQSHGRRTTWLALICISCFPLLNEFRGYVVRDIGFLAFMLLALIQLIHYKQSLWLRHGLMFCVYVLLAFLFRPEALLYFVILPIAILLPGSLQEGHRRAAYLRLSGLMLALGAIAILLTGLTLQVNLSEQLIRFASIYQPFLQSLGNLFDPEPAIANAIFGEYGAQFVGNYAGLFMLAGLLAMTLACVVDSLGMVVAPLLVYSAWKRRVHLPRDARSILLSSIVVASAILIAFAVLTRFLTTRYTLLLCILLLVYLPFVIDYLWRQSVARNKSKCFYAIAGFLLLYCTLDAHVSFGGQKHHLYEAATWVEQYTRAEAPLVTNEVLIAYDSGKIERYDETPRRITAEQLRAAPLGSIIAITPDDALMPVLEAEMNRGSLRLLQRFEADRGADFIILEKELN